MARDLDAEIKQLKSAYFDLAESHRDEKEALIKVINAFGTLITLNGETTEEVRAIKDRVGSDRIPISGDADPGCRPDGSQEIPALHRHTSLAIGGRPCSPYPHRGRGDSSRTTPS